MKSIIVLMGRTNVGKSSLFNFLTKSKDALIDKNSGTTVDRNYGFFYIKKKKIKIIDTAGIENQYFFLKKSIVSLEKNKLYQTKLALKQANLIFFIVDLKKGLTNIELVILQEIRKKKKKIFLLVNKIDCKKYMQNIWEFYELGIKKLYQISVSHNIGLDLLKNDIFIFFKKNNYFCQEKKPLCISEKYLNQNSSNLKIEKILKILFVGPSNVGKSTLINSILQEKRMIVSNTPGTTKEVITIPFEYKKKKYIFFDSAGFQKKKKNSNYIDIISNLKTINAIKKVDICIFMLDATKEISNKVIEYLKKVILFASSFLILINKWDLILFQKKNLIKKLILQKLYFLQNFKIIYISALKNFQIYYLLKMIEQVYKNSVREFTPTLLTHLVNEAVAKQSMPMDITGKSMHLKYAHLGGKKPYIIVIHGTRLHSITNTYKKYLTNFLKKKLNIFSSVLKLSFREKFNPYLKK